MLAKSMAADVAQLLEAETVVDPQLDAFLALCNVYRTLPG
jgi:hypothetical protein